MRRFSTIALAAAAAIAASTALLPLAASGANQRCDGAEHDCGCAPSTICWCCNEDTSFGETCGNCVWWTWHEACCHWDVALEFCGNANVWDDSARSYGYPVGGDAQVQSIFVRESGTWGHVGWVVTVYPDGGWDSTEMMCGGPCGILDRHRDVGYANAFIYNPGGPVEVDDAQLDSETIPAGTRFSGGEAFTKNWTLLNTGTTTWTRDGGYVLAWDGDERFGADEQTLLPAGVSVEPGDTCGWDVPMTAPTAPGTYRGYWKMERSGSGKFGERVSVEIVVDEPVETMPEPEPALPEPIQDASTDLAPDPVDDQLPDIDSLPDADDQGSTAPYDLGGGCACMISLPAF